MLIAAPMHGETKLRTEGFRTRDGHFLEWFTTLEPERTVAVMSRAEPWPRVSVARARARGQAIPRGLEWSTPEPFVIPNLRRRRAWWVDSLKHRRPWPEHTGAVGWNPFEVAAAVSANETRGPLVFDLLDDWLVHPAFAPIYDEVLGAYRTVFGRADYVVANSEATAEMARSQGRDDVVLMPNGVDPDRFLLPPVAHESLVVGYGGKIGFRLDVDLVNAVASALPEVTFEFAGPVLDREVAHAIKGRPNVRLLGDIRYDRYPEVLRGWDVAWAPHAIGRKEVGGDLIKLYEYRAAGLPVYTTKVIGWERALDGVRVLDKEDAVDTIVADLKGLGAGALSRETPQFPPDTTWESKAVRLLEMLGYR